MSSHSGAAVPGKHDDPGLYAGRVPSPSDAAEIRFVGVSLDCADPDELATFYLNLLGGRLLWSKDQSAAIQTPGVLLVMQRVADYEKPAWPGTSIVHLDLTAGDHLDGPEQRALALGATRAEPQPDTRWRVLLDPAGHPFCITTLAPPPEMLKDVYGH
jgi:hypothetical protein